MKHSRYNVGGPVIFRAGCEPGLTAADPRPESDFFFQQGIDKGIVAIHLEQHVVAEAKTPVINFSQAGDGQDMLQLREVFFRAHGRLRPASDLLSRAFDLYYMLPVGAQAVQAGPHPVMLARLDAHRLDSDAGVVDVSQPGHGFERFAALHGAIGGRFGFLRPVFSRSSSPSFCQGESPMMTGASEAPMPSRRQESHSLVLCSKFSLIKDSGDCIFIYPFSTTGAEKQSAPCKRQLPF